MKKEIERLQREYADVLKGNVIIVQMEKSDPLDNRSSRCYRIFVVIDFGDVICEYGECKFKENLLQRFENKLKARREIR